jgi:hypothetical protein
MSHELSDQDEVAEARIEAGFGGDGQQDVVGAAGRQAAAGAVDWAGVSAGANSSQPSRPYARLLPVSGVLRPDPQ